MGHFCYSLKLNEVRENKQKNLLRVVDLADNHARKEEGFATLRAILRGPGARIRPPAKVVVVPVA